MRAGGGIVADAGPERLRMVRSRCVWLLYLPDLEEGLPVEVLATHNKRTCRCTRRE